MRDLLSPSSSSSFSSSLSSHPHTEYTQRLKTRQTVAQRQGLLEQRIGTARLSLFVLAAGVGWFVCRPGLLAWWWLALPAVGFFGLVLLHERARRSVRLAERSVAFYEKGLARLEDRWAGTGESGADFLEETHPYAADLDLFGSGSLFELLCTARTRGGERTLARWLQTPADPQEIQARQTAVEELRPKLDLREELVLRGTDIRAGIDPDLFSKIAAQWAEISRFANLSQARLLAAGLAACSTLSLIGWQLNWFGPMPFFIAGTLAGGYALLLRPKIKHALAGIERLVHDLSLLSEILACLENEQFTSPRLTQLRNQLDTDGLPPSGQIAQLQRLISLLESRKNQFFVPIAALLMWTTQVGLAIEAWRRNSGQAVASWLAVVGEFEALSALASYAYEHPTDPFPEILPSGPRFESKGLGHPLLADSACVRNDVQLGAPLQVLVVSGSNMSGKSTLLRTIGTNTVLALAGAPVRAESLRLSPLMPGATLRIQDSLQAGSSRFYAEITRLSQIMDLTQASVPVLFLLDEILHGTNSHDREIGAEAIVRSLLKRNAIGLVTTHDLALAHVAEALAPQAANVCFEDHFEDGQIRFDYRMRSGIAQKSNALALMRSVGLDV